MTKRLMICGLVAMLATACGPKECKLDDPSTCSTDQACEQVSGEDKPQCFAPVTLEGKVFDLSNSAGIKGALVLAVDENGAPAGPAVTTTTDGAWSLRVPSTRTDDKGTFTSRKVMLRSQAKNFLPFPSAARISLPIDTSAAARTDDTKPFVLKSPLTDIGLNPVDAAARNFPSVSGTVEMGAGQRSVLLVLESGGRTALAGSDGKFTFFNVPGGGYKLSAYSRGVNYGVLDVQA